MVWIAGLRRFSLSVTAIETSLPNHLATSTARGHIPRYFQYAMICRGTFSLLPRRACKEKHRDIVPSSNRSFATKVHRGYVSVGTKNIYIKNRTISPHNPGAEGCICRFAGLHMGRFNSVGPGEKNLRLVLTSTACCVHTDEQPILKP